MQNKSTREKKSIADKIISIIFLIVVIGSLKVIYDVYKQNYFNDFVKAEYISGVSEFKRDNKIKYNKNESYRISSPEFNDAMFYKTISVIPNTPYRVTCMVKTENVVTQKKASIAGAGICISDTTECSVSVKGSTNGWQKLVFYFDSKNRTKLNIGFRLGSYSDNCKGTAWFSDLKVEVGVKNYSTNWNIACFAVENLDVNINIDGKVEHIQEKLTEGDIQTLDENLTRAKNAMKELSNRKYEHELYYNKTYRTCNKCNLREGEWILLICR